MNFQEKPDTAPENNTRYMKPNGQFEATSNKESEE